jgi:hypothetical protein
MASAAKPRIGRLLLWLSVGVASVLAFELPRAWIAYSDRQTHRGNFLNFHPLLAVLYVPLAFGLIWPLLIGIAALAKQRLEGSVGWLAKTAIIMFAFSVCCSAPLVVFEYRSLTRGLEAVNAENLRLAKIRNQLEMEKQKALAELRADGAASLNEPLTGPQVEAVNSYLDAHSQDPDELQKAARHYRTNVQVMEHLAQSRYCPGPVLEIVFDNIVEVQKASPPSLPVNPSEVLYYLAWNPRLPVAVLIQMLDNPDSSVRAAAAANPRLPENIKASYLGRAQYQKAKSPP